MISFLILSTTLMESQVADLTNARYLRLANQQWVLESEVRLRPREYVSVTVRPKETMTLRLKHKVGNYEWAEAVSEVGGLTRSVKVTFDSNKAKVLRDGKEEEYSFKTKPIVTTAPDWSDIIWLMVRYDSNKGGKQEFEGLWIHPVQATRVMTFSIERLGTDTFQGKDGEVKVGRFRITLRSGAYLVWGFYGGRVIKLMPVGRPEQAVVLEGFEEFVQGLQ